LLGGSGSAQARLAVQDAASVTTEMTTTPPCSKRAAISTGSSASPQLRSPWDFPEV
jgi:hypothetical protein